ncbi:TPA: chlorohydrolase [bacterium]|nr:chlorohydrolase [bacterium]
MSILIKDVLLDDEEETDIYIEGNQIKKIGQSLDVVAEKTIDGKGKFAIPPFINGHTHSAMTLLRGYADDMPLMEWLSEKIWPLETKMTEEDIYWGAKLACLEMIRSGITVFNDMYWHFHGTSRAVEEMGIRALVSAVFIDFFDKTKANEQIELNERLFEETKSYSNRITFCLGPHSIYTVSEESLRWVKNFSNRNDVFIHIHISETQNELKECIKRYRLRPIEYLKRIGFLSDKIIACHCVWLDQEEMEILKNYNIQCVFNPISNMKLSSGKIFPYPRLIERGIGIILGTDGPSSNNSLNMFETMKIASLLIKHDTKDPTSLPAKEVFNLATNKAFGINTGIEEGNLADIVLLELNRPELTPSHNVISNIVYSGNPSCVSTVICDGKILMEDGYIEGEDEIMERAKEQALSLIRR